MLVSGFSTQQFDRGLWSDMKSTLMFDPKPRPKQPGAGKSGSYDDEVVSLRPLTTEGRMWEWMYGAGPHVPGITPTADLDRGEEVDGAVTATRRRMGELLRETTARQRCVFCQEPFEVKSRSGWLSVCRNGHFFSICGTSGLTIQAPGISRTCGVCGSRTLKVEAIVSAAPELEDRIREEYTGDACGNCGGKFVD